MSALFSSVLLCKYCFYFSTSIILIFLLDAVLEFFLFFKFYTVHVLPVIHVCFHTRADNATHTTLWTTLLDYIQYKGWLMKEFSYVFLAYKMWLSIEKCKKSSWCEEVSQNYFMLGVWELSSCSTTESFFSRILCLRTELFKRESYENWGTTVHRIRDYFIKIHCWKHFCGK